MSDSLSVESRKFFERTKLKQATSIVLGAVGVFLLGFTAWTGGMASAANNHLQSSAVKNADDEVQKEYNSIAGGFGFACFLFILGFLMTTLVAIYYSPLFCGSVKEKTMLRSPHELEGGQQQV